MTKDNTFESRLSFAQNFEDLYLYFFLNTLEKNGVTINKKFADIGIRGFRATKKAGSIQ